MAKAIGSDFIPSDIYGKVTGRAKYAEDFRMDGMLFFLSNGKYVITLASLNFLRS